MVQRGRERMVEGELMVWYFLHWSGWEVGEWKRCGVCEGDVGMI